MAAITEIAPRFIATAHRIVWATVATVTADGAPRTRILHPIWEFDGSTLSGWIATDPSSPKANDLAARPEISLTYWDATHDTCTADCTVVWETADDERIAAWKRFASAPEPVGYDPAIVPGWTDPTAASFGVVRLAPTALRVMPGSLMLRGEGAVMTWRSDAQRSR